MTAASTLSSRAWHVSAIRNQTAVVCLARQFARLEIAGYVKSGKTLLIKPVIEGCRVSKTTVARNGNAAARSIACRADQGGPREIIFDKLRKFDLEVLVEEI